MSTLATTLLMLVLQALPLQGIVYKKGTNEPLSDATVELRQDQENGAVLRNLTTEDDGRFAFDNVAPGHYRVTVSRRGYTRPPVTVVVDPRQAAGEIQLPMSQAGTISGRVYDANGQPMGNVEVLAIKASFPGGRRILSPVQSVVTNDLGEYRLFWLAPGRYYVSAVHPKTQGTFRQMFNGLGIGISASGISVGSMIRSASKPDPALGVFDPETESERYTPVFYGGTTDEQSASGIDIRAGTEVGGANIMVAPVRPRHVRGVVIDGLTGRPAQFASLALVTDSDGPRGKEFSVDHENASFDIELLPGSHTLNATSASGEGSVTFQLLDTDIDNLAVPTTQGFDIAGRIVVECEPNSGAALGPLHMTMLHDPPRRELSSSALSYSTPLPNGSFVVSASTGDYRLNIDPLLNVAPPRVAITTLPPTLQNAYVKSIRLGNTDVLNGTLHLEGKPSVLIEVLIGKNSGAIDGQAVVTNRQAPASDVSVVLIPDVRRRTELYRTTTADVSGHFHLDHIAPGSYKVFSWEEVQDGAWYDPEFLRTNENRGVPVQILEGRTANVRVEAIP